MISVIVCTYNRCNSLRETLEALKNQDITGGLKVELIVVDNNSTDQTRDVVQEAARETRWPMCYAFETRQGLSHARNRGIQEAHGEWVAFTDDDVIPDPGWLSSLWKAAREYDADSVGGPILPLWIKPPPKWLSEAIDKKLFWAVFALLDHGQETIVSKEPENGLLYGANMAFKRGIFGDVGFFRTDLGPVGRIPLRGDDTDMIKRLLANGKRVIYAPCAIVKHKIAPERMRMSYIRRWKFHQGLSSSRALGVSSNDKPTRLIRQCVQTGSRVLRAHLSNRRDIAIQLEANFYTQLGRLAGTANLRSTWYL